jgi:hypothetical protein
MLCITVRQPWAWAIFNATPIKDIENRDWALPKKYYGCTVAIHAAKGMTYREYDEAAEFIWNVGIAYGHRVVIPTENMLTRGAIIGTVEIATCVSSSGSPWFMGKFGFVLKNAKPFPDPIPARGALGFWEPDTLTAMAINRQEIARL